MFSKYVLSICIPTYNRAELLESLIDNLVLQIEGNYLNVQICISDNNSTDSTATLLKNKYLHINYIEININAVNCGFDYNVCRLLNMAAGKFVWFLSDDDIIDESSLSKLTSYLSLEGANLGVICIAPVFFKNGTKPKYTEFDITKRFNFKNSDCALRKANWLVSFMSAFILRRNQIDPQFQNYMGLGFIHTPMIIDSIHNGEFVFLSNGLLYARQGNGGGYDKYKYFGPNFNRILRDKQKYGFFSKETIDFVLTKWLSEVVYGNIVLDKQESRFRFKNFRNICVYKNLVFFWRYIIPRTILPEELFTYIANFRGRSKK